MNYNFEEEEENPERNDEWINENRRSATAWLHANDRFFGNHQEDISEPAIFYKVNEFDIMIAVRDNKGVMSARPTWLNEEPYKFREKLKANVKLHLDWKITHQKQKNKEELPNHE